MNSFNFLTKRVFPIALFSAFIIVISCGKGRLNRQTTSAKDFTLASNLFDDLFNVVDRNDDSEKEIDDNSRSGLNDTCFTHPNHSCLTICKEYIDVDNWEWKVTLDFGTSGCTAGDGRSRKGKIFAHRKGRYRIQGSTAEVTTENYFVDNHQVEGVRLITNIGRNAQNKLQYQIEEQGEITTPDNKDITWTSSRLNTWAEGSETWIFGTLHEDGSIDQLFWNWPDGIYDDVWEISGTAEGINREGRAFDAQITVPLRVQWCPPAVEITKGVLEVQPEDLKLRTVDYGNGDCDNEASVEIGNNTFTFNLR
jgi:hypothetical protein